MTRSDSSRCPDPETLAAFVAGTLSEVELTMTADHLNDCGRCRAVAAEAVRASRGEYATVVPLVPVASKPASHGPKWWLIAVAAAAVIGIVSAGVYRWRAQSAAIRELAEAMPREGRYVEARLSGGFRWAPLRPVHRDANAPLDPGEMRVMGAAGEVLEKTAGDTSIEGRHATALAHLLAGRAEQADALLTAAARGKNDAAIWSDLAAARYTAAVRTGDPSGLASALAAADEALELDPDSPEALFNRALIVERLGLRQQARAAWQRYLAVDRDSDWAREAQRHLDALVPPAAFGNELERKYEQLVRDVSAARALVHRYPQEARTWGETEILGRWASATNEGKHDSAQKHLALATSFGDELAALHGDRMLLEAASAIRHADARRRRLLAEAHLLFRSAQASYKALRPAEARERFRAAAAAFESGESPVALLARYFEANTLYDLGHVSEAQERLERLLADVPPQFSAYRAQLEWQLGLVLASRARWGEGIDTLTESIRTFERLGEMKYATTVRDILAEVYDRIGDPRSAWKHRIVVLQELGRSDHPKLMVTLDAAARGAALTEDWPVSMALLGLKLEAAADGGDDPLYVHTLLLRARIAAMLARPQSVQAELQRAAAAMARLEDDAYRERAEAERAALEGFLAGSPAAAVRLLSKAIDFHRTKGGRMALPDLLLQRGRARLRAGDLHGAAADFDAGIEELEVQRSSIEPGEERWGVFGAVDDLFDEAMMLALDRRDFAGAFAYAERARARELLESVGAPGAPAAGPQDGAAVIVEYATHPNGMVIFVADGGRISAVRNEVTRDALDREVAQLSEHLMAENETGFRRMSAVLYSRLIAPIAAILPQNRLLVFVPDSALRSVPFAALIDRQGAYLVERHAIVVAPSAAVFRHLAARARPESRDLRLLVVAGPAAEQGDVRYLRESSREAGAVESVYSTRERLPPRDSDEESFAARASEADVVHFVGHAVTDARFHAALVTTTNGERSDGRLDVREIAAMRLRRPRLIVLAACSSGRGQELTGEGNISVARAFLAAGVPSVVATLWPIDEGLATEFFPRFHQYIAGGLSPADALRRAQVDAIRDRRTPSMWAAVQVIGS